MTTDRTAAGVLAEAAGIAGRAPSVHNTQPWRWRVHSGRLDLFAERTRQLGAADPDGRLLTISCGTALHHARVALATAGWQPVVERFPTPADPDHVARLRLGEQAAVTAETMRRFEATHARRTDRRPVTDTPVPFETVAAIRDAVEEEHAHLHLLRDEQVSELAVAAGQADELQTGQPATREELEYWVGGQRPAGTGIPDTAVPTQPPRTGVPVRDFGRPGTLPADQGSDRAATYAVVFGDHDEPAGWLRGGEALSAAWLTATDRGVAMLPFSAPVETPATRAVLRRLLAELGHPYLVVRLGVADPSQAGPAYTPRLDAAQTVEIADEDYQV